MAKRKGKKRIVKRTKQRRKSINTKSNKRLEMEFCKRCGSIMVPVKARTVHMQCRGCGYKTREKVRDIKIKEGVKQKKQIVVLENDPTMLPTTEKICPNCEHNRAYWWLQQTRASDEPPTQFFRCVKCHRVWREYK